MTGTLSSPFLSTMSEHLWSVVRAHLRSRRRDRTYVTSLLAGLSTQELQKESLSRSFDYPERTGIAWLDLPCGLPSCPEVGRHVWKRMAPPLFTLLKDWRQAFPVEEQASSADEEREEAFTHLLRGALRWGLPEEACTLVNDLTPLPPVLARHVLRVFLEEKHGHLILPLPQHTSDTSSSPPSHTLSPHSISSKEKRVLATSTPALHCVTTPSWSSFFWAEAPLDFIWTLPEETWVRLLPHMTRQFSPLALLREAMHAFQSDDVQERIEHRQTPRLLHTRLNACVPEWETVFVTHLTTLWHTSRDMPSQTLKDQPFSEKKEDIHGIRPTLSRFFRRRRPLEEEEGRWVREDTTALSLNPSKLKRAAEAQGPDAIRALLWAQIVEGKEETQNTWWRWARRHLSFENLWSPSGTLCTFTPTTTHATSPAPASLLEALACPILLSDIRSPLLHLQDIVTPLTRALRACHTVLTWCPAKSKASYQQACHALLEVFLLRHTPVLSRLDALHGSRKEEMKRLSQERFFFRLPQARCYGPEESIDTWMRTSCSLTHCIEMHACLQAWGEWVEMSWWEAPPDLTVANVRACYLWGKRRTFWGLKALDVNDFEEEISFYERLQKGVPFLPTRAHEPLSRGERWRTVFPWLERLHVQAALESAMPSSSKSEKAARVFHRGRL